MHTILPLWTALQNLKIGMQSQVWCVHVAAQFWNSWAVCKPFDLIRNWSAGLGLCEFRKWVKKPACEVTHLCVGHFHQLLQHVRSARMKWGFDCRQQLSVVSRTTATGSSPGHKWHSSHAIHRCLQLLYAVVTALFLASYKAGLHLSCNPFWPLYILGLLVQSSFSWLVRFWACL